MTFKPGDMFYYSPHHATGILISCEQNAEGETLWTYCLRSPSAGDYENKQAHKLSLKTAPEETFLRTLADHPKEFSRHEANFLSR